MQKWWLELKLEFKKMLDTSHVAKIRQKEEAKTKNCLSRSTLVPLLKFFHHLKPLFLDALFISSLRILKMYNISFQRKILTSVFLILSHSFHYHLVITCLCYQGHLQQYLVKYFSLLCLLLAPWSTLGVHNQLHLHLKVQH